MQQNHSRNARPTATPSYLSRSNTPPLVFPEVFLPNSSPRFTQQLTTDYTLNLHVWNKVAEKMNKMAQENRLIKQTVLCTYKKMKSRYSVLRTRNQNNSKDDSDKQINQSSKKSIKFKPNSGTEIGHSSTVTHSGSAMYPILKSNPSLATSNNLVSTIAKETESQLEAEAEGQTHNLSSDCEVIMNTLHLDVDYSSDSNSDKLTYADE